MQMRKKYITIKCNKITNVMIVCKSKYKIIEHNARKIYARQDFSNLLLYYTLYLNIKAQQGNYVLIILINLMWRLIK